MRNEEIAYNKGYRISKNGDILGIKGKALKNHIGNRGYIIFTVNRKLKVPAHRFQAYIKYKEKIFDDDIVVRHLDGNKLNNSWDNILIGTYSENQLDRTIESRVNGASHPKHDHLEILKDRDDGMTYKEIMEKHNISSKGTVSFIINKSLKT